MRWLVLFHRYAGIVLGILMAAWCLSGLVMMYVGYPSLEEPDRLRALRPLDLHSCCAFAPGENGLDDDARIASFQLEMLAGRPLARLYLEDGTWRMLDLASDGGSAIDSVSPQQARAVAADFAGPSASLKPDRVIDHDQWTVAGIARRERPLYRFAVDDRQGTEAYVSQRTGRLVQATTARQRFWNWLGAVPHWLYFTALRSHPHLWSQVVVWTSFAGCFLVATGLWLGVQRFLRRPPGHWSPYRGLLLWHHVPGLIAGVFALTWVASGLISMNPWGFLDSSDDGPPRTGTISGAQARRALEDLSRAPPPGRYVSIASSLFDGKLYLIATTAADVRTRLDAQGIPRPLSATEIQRQARSLTGTDVQPELMTAEDPYYFSHHRETAPLPVYRCVLPDAERTRYYIDPLSGALLRRVDGNSRWYRWLHEGLHRMDFTPVLRARPLWDAVMWALMSGVATLCCTGAVLGIRRLRPRPG